MKEYVVYIATNKNNGHSYVGFSINGLHIRKQSHKEASNIARPGCVKFYRAIRKYGWDAFEWKVLVTCPSKEEMISEEIRLIAELKPEYNLTRGGEGIVGWVRTKEWKEKVSKTQLGKTKKGFKQPIVCLNDGILFPSIRSAARFYSINYRLIGEILSGRAFTTSNGLSFIYSKEDVPEEVRRAILDIKIKETKKHLRQVICKTDNKKFDSLTSAASYYKLSLPCVFQKCNLGGKTRSGLSFEYAT